MSEEAEIPSSLLSEFYVQAIGRIIPGSIFVFLYLNIEIPTKDISPAAFIFLCVAWFCGSTIDVGSEQICSYLFRKLERIFSKQDEEPNPSHRGNREGFSPDSPHHRIMRQLMRQYFRDLFRRYTSKHKFMLELPINRLKRDYQWFVCEKIFFRSMGVIFLFVCFKCPSCFPFSEWGFWYGVMGIAICLLCWNRAQLALNTYEKDLKTNSSRSRLRRARKVGK